ncbi:MAG: hypothetical protein J5802_03355 [Butyrivibrio sp.]|nr:hypothetical protein [Butyrivibrio sp.]
MKKRFLKLTGTIVTAAMLMTACSLPTDTDNEDIEITAETDDTTSTEPTTQEPEEETEEPEKAIDVDATEGDSATKNTGSASLPAYEYPGPELYYAQIYKYIVDQYSSDYTSADVCIPYINEIKSESDSFYGDFWVYHYKLEGDTLVCVSAKAHPGILHLDQDYNVTGMDVVTEGDTESAKTVFGKYYDQYSKISADSAGRNKIRAQIISNYVSANNLNITQYKDEGGETVKLPEQNIDNFYSPDL